jgi:hypothetical protein
MFHFIIIDGVDDLPFLVPRQTDIDRSGHVIDGYLRDGKGDLGDKWWARGPMYA